MRERVGVHILSYRHQREPKQEKGSSRSQEKELYREMKGVGKRGEQEEGEG